MFAVPRALPVGPPDRSLGGGRGCGGHRLVVGDLRRSGRRLAESFGDLLTKRHPASLQLGEDLQRIRNMPPSAQALKQGAITNKTVSWTKVACVVKRARGEARGHTRLPS